MVVTPAQRYVYFPSTFKQHLLNRTVMIVCLFVFIYSEQRGQKNHITVEGWMERRREGARRKRGTRQRWDMVAKTSEHAKTSEAAGAKKLKGKGKSIGKLCVWQVEHYYHLNNQNVCVINFCERHFIWSDLTTVTQSSQIQCSAVENMRVGHKPLHWFHGFWYQCSCRQLPVGGCKKGWGGVLALYNIMISVITTNMTWLDYYFLS